VKGADSRQDKVTRRGHSAGSSSLSSLRESYQQQGKAVIIPLTPLAREYFSAIYVTELQLPTAVSDYNLREDFL